MFNITVIEKTSIALLICGNQCLKFCVYVALVEDIRKKSISIQKLWLYGRFESPTFGLLSIALPIELILTYFGMLIFAKMNVARFYFVH